MMEIVRSSLLAEIKTVKHGFFTRNGGVSRGVFSSMNGGFASGDDPSSVLENRKIAMKNIGAEEAAFINCYQVHSDVVERVTAPYGDMDPRADGMVTNKRGMALVIFTADCVPVLLAARDGTVIGAAHVGWKGGVTGILENTVREIRSLQSKRADIVAAIGPCIQKSSYQVGFEVRNAYLAKDEQNTKYFERDNNERWRFDLSTYVADQLSKNEIIVWKSDEDTYSNEEKYFSARRAAHRGESQYGRMMSIIVM